MYLIDENIKLRPISHIVLCHDRVITQGLIRNIVIGLACNYSI